MGFPVTIGEREVVLDWTQDVAKRLAFRSSRIGGAPAMRALTTPKTAVYAVTTWLWLLLPPAVHDQYATPEDLFVAIDHEEDGPAIHAALVAVFSEMGASDEKKSTLPKSPSPKSS